MSATESVFGKYEFTPEELDTKRLDIIIAIHNKTLKENEKKAVVKEFGSEIANLDEQIKTLSTHIRDGYEYRHVNCRVERIFDRKLKRYWSVSTGQLVREEPFSEADYQLRMDE